MNPDLVRAIDFYAGIPICWVLSAFNTIRRLAFPVKRPFNPDETRAILFIELSEMGSAILAYPAMMKLKRRLPKATIYFLIFERNRESVSILNFVDEDNILTIRDDSLLHFSLDVLNLFIFHQRKFDVCFDLELFSRCTAILSLLSRAKRVVGFHGYYVEGLYRGNFLTHKVCYNPYRHMSANFLAMADCLLDDRQHLTVEIINSDDGDLTLPRHASDPTLKRQVTEKLSKQIKLNAPIVVLNPDPGSFLPIRGWGADNYARLTEMILKDTDAIVIVVGLDHGDATGKRVAKTVDDERCVDFVGETESLRELLELLAVANVLVTNDGGPAHFASLVDIDTIVFFGPETPVLYAPLGDRHVLFHENLQCSPCLSAFNHRKTACVDNRCLRRIQPESVFQAVLNALRGKTK